MLELLKKWQENIQEDLDPRVSEDWFLMAPVPSILSLVAYYAAVKVILPKFMENRKPYRLNNVLVIYNAIQVTINGYLFYLALHMWYGVPTNSIWRCSSVDRSNNPQALQAINGIYLYFLSKYVDFFDTFFFILRKKYNQVTFLHVYHHISTPFFTWIVLRLYPGGSYTFFMLLNTFVHIVMYNYYMLAAMGPKVQKYLWWKKYITRIQLLQFTIGLSHSTLILLSSECNLSKTMLALYMLNGFLFVWLFGKFYVTSYQQRRKSKDLSTQERKNSKTINPNTAENIKKRILL